MAQTTQPHDGSVDDFINEIGDDVKRSDCIQLCRIMEDVTGEESVMWGTSIVGFGKYHYVYESGTEGDWLLTGFSPRKKNLSIYMMDGFKNHKQLLSQLGKHKTSVSCLYISRLSDVDLGILEKLLRASIKNIRKKYC